MISENIRGLSMKTLFLTNDEALKIGNEILGSFPEGWEFKIREDNHLKSGKRFLIEFFNKKEKLYSYHHTVETANGGSKDRFIIHHQDEMMSSYIGSGDTPREAIKDLRKKIKTDVEYLKSVLNNISK